MQQVNDCYSRASLVLVIFFQLLLVFLLRYVNSSDQQKTNFPVSLKSV